MHGCQIGIEILMKTHTLIQVNNDKRE